jgi:hypothetical protein
MQKKKNLNERNSSNRAHAIASRFWRDAHARATTFSRQVHASNPAIEMLLWSVTAAAVVKPCDYLHTDKTSFHFPSVFNSVFKNFSPKFCQIWTWEIWFRPIERIFQKWKKLGPKFASFPGKKKKIQIAKFLW